MDFSASISGMDMKLHPPEYCGMQLLIPAWDNHLTSGTNVVVYTNRACRHGDHVEDC